MIPVVTAMGEPEEWLLRWKGCQRRSKANPHTCILPKPLIGPRVSGSPPVHAGEHDYPAYPGQVSMECVPLSQPPHPRPRPRPGGNVTTCQNFHLFSSRPLLFLRTLLWPLPMPKRYCLLHQNFIHPSIYMLQLILKTKAKAIAKYIFKASVIASVSFPHQSAGGEKSAPGCVHCAPAPAALWVAGTSAAS